MNTMTAPIDPIAAERSLSETDSEHSKFKVPTPVYAVLSLWLAAAWWVGDIGLFVADTSHAFRPIALSAMIPVGLFFAVYALSPALRGWTATIPVALLTGLQAWRVIGFTFLPLWFFDVLPAPFGLVAGLGDVAVGFGAAFVAYAIAKDPTLIGGKAFKNVHIAGLVDFAAAIATAFLTSGAFPTIWSGPVTSAAMEVWPLNVFPSFGVPLFIILHVIALLNARTLATHQQTGG